MKTVNSPVSGTVVGVGRGWLAIRHRTKAWRPRWRDRVVLVWGMQAVSMRVGAKVTNRTTLGHSLDATLMIDIPYDLYVRADDHEH